MKFKKIAALLGAFTIASSLLIAGCGQEGIVRRHGA